MDVFGGRGCHLSACHKFGLSFSFPKWSVSTKQTLLEFSLLSVFYCLFCLFGAMPLICIRLGLFGQLYHSLLLSLVQNTTKDSFCFLKQFLFFFFAFPFSFLLPFYLFISKFPNSKSTNIHKDQTCAVLQVQSNFLKNLFMMVDGRLNIVTHMFLLNSRGRR